MLCISDIYLKWYLNLLSVVQCAWPILRICMFSKYYNDTTDDATDPSCPSTYQTLILDILVRVLTVTIRRYYSYFHSAMLKWKVNRCCQNLNLSFGLYNAIGDSFFGAATCGEHGYVCFIEASAQISDINPIAPKRGYYDYWAS